MLLLLFQFTVFSQTNPITIMTYNTKDASSWDTRKPYLHNVISAIDPDIIVAIEINNSNTDDFLTNVLNSSSTIYSKGTFIANSSSISHNSNCLYYKTSKFINGTFSNTIITSYDDLNGTTQDRDINRFTIQHTGGNTIVIYAVHLRSSGSTPPGTSTIRAAEISYLQNYIADNAPSSTSENFIVLGDFNIDDPTDGGYKNLFVSQGGYFYDPSNPTEIFTGSWNQSAFIPYLSFRTSGINDKFDNILISGNVKDNIHGIQYYSDSFTVYGNPGNYNSSTSDTDVLNASDHLPVYAVFDFADNPAPVELVSFIGAANGNQVDLHWETATEVNNYGFEIERSTFSPGTDWKSIGFIKGNGNSNSPKYYNYTDRNIQRSDSYYYRLKQIDNDGTYKYTNIININVSLPNKYYLSHNYPNPFNPETKIDFSIPQKQMVTLKVYNTLGKQVAELVNEVRDAGNYSVIFNGSNLPSGIYIYRLQTPEYMFNQKMILLK